MTRALYPGPGQLILHVIVTSRRNGRRFTTQEIGTKGLGVVSRQYKDPDMIRRATLNAVYKHMNKGGGSDAITKVVGSEFRYYDDFVSRKRVKRFDKRTNKTEFWSEVRRKTDNKLLSPRVKWRMAEEI